MSHSGLSATVCRVRALPVRPPSSSLRPSLKADREPPLPPPTCAKREPRYHTCLVSRVRGGDATRSPATAPPLTVTASCTTRLWDRSASIQSAQLCSIEPVGSCRRLPGTLLTHFRLSPHIEKTARRATTVDCLDDDMDRVVQENDVHVVTECVQTSEPE